MFKCLMFTDLHMGVHSNSPVWLNASLELADEMKETCESNDIHDILFLGDFFHDRKTINSNTLWMANEFIKRLEGLDLWMIVGNHDTYLKNNIKPHSLRSFENIEYVHIIDETYRLNNYITMVPWNCSVKNHKTPFLCGHFDISGCEISSNFTESQDTNNIKEFKNYECVFSGHFHGYNISKNIFYIGSVMPFTFADINCKRGYYIMEFENEKDLSYHFIEFKKCPKYIILSTETNLDNINLENNIIKLVYDKELSAADNDMLLSKIWEKKPLYVYTDLRNLSTEINSEAVREDIDFKNTRDILFEYINLTTLPEHIKQDALRTKINELLEK